MLQILCATLLTPDDVIINNIPDIRDVNKLIELLIFLGVETSKAGESTYKFNAKNIDLDKLDSDEFVKKSGTLRGSIMIVGPLLGRFGKGYYNIRYDYSL